MKRFLPLWGILGFLCHVPLGAQSQVTPSWVDFGLGKREFDRGEWAQAMILFRKAIEKKGIYPEAERALANSLGQTGDPLLTRKTLEKALAEADFLENPQEKIEILYDLAHLEALGPNSKTVLGQGRVVGALEDVLKEDLFWQEIQEGKGSSAAVLWRGFLNWEPDQTPLDRLLYLFAQRGDLFIEAHQMLGEMMSGRPGKNAWDLASEHFLIASLYLLSRLRDEFEQLEPGLEKPTLKVIFSEDYLGGDSETVQPSEFSKGHLLGKFVPLDSFLKETRFWETLWNLAKSLKERPALGPMTRPPAHGLNETAHEIFNFISTYGPKGTPVVISAKNLLGKR